VAIWCLLMPVTGFVLLPVQGTIPAYLLAFASIFWVLMKVRAGEVDPRVVRYFKAALGLFCLWLILLVGSQLGLIFSSRHDFGDIPLIDPNDTSIVFRLSLFTQSIYLMACVLITLYFRYFFRPEWMRYVFWGAYLLAIYGIYEWLYFLVFHQTGDFLANRMFGDHPGSWSQSVPVGGLQLLRIKSTLGEPTFFAAVVLPYFYMAWDEKKYLLVGLLLFAAVFSISTALYLTLSLTLLLKSFWSGKVRVGNLAILALVGTFLAGVAVLFPDLFRNIFEDKLNGTNQSGAIRYNGGAIIQSLFDSFTIPNWIFGLGVGYVYQDIYHGLIMNTGLIGLIAFLVAFGIPVIFLPIKPGCEGFKLGLLCIMILGRLSLSELFLPTTWMFLGLAYFQLERFRIRRNQRGPAEIEAVPVDALGGEKSEGSASI
jgi:hypothetical protein